VDRLSESLDLDAHERKKLRHFLFRDRVMIVLVEDS